MSIASELERLIDAKAAIRSAIAAQGVSVPSDATLDEYPGYIAMIEGGDPVDTEPAAFTAGQWTATAGVEQIEIDITALPDDGGSAITVLQYRLDAGTWTNLTGTGTGVRTITGLTGDVEYDVQLRAVNAIGNGAASDTKSRTPSASGGGGTPSELVFGANTGDDAALVCGGFSQYGSYFGGAETQNVATTKVDPGDWLVCLISPNLAGNLPLGAEITSVQVEMYITERWLAPNANIHECLRAVVVSGSGGTARPNLDEYSTGNAWAGEGGSGVGDKSASLASAVVPTVSSLMTIPSSSGLVAALQAWADGSRAAPFWMYVSSSGTGDPEFAFSGAGGSAPDGQRVRIRVGYTA